MVNLGNYHITNKETSIKEKKGEKKPKFSMVTVSPVVSVDGAQEGVTLAEDTAKV